MRILRSPIFLACAASAVLLTGSIMFALLRHSRQKEVLAAGAPAGRQDLPSPFEIKSVEPKGETGTMHYDERLEIGAGKLRPLVLVTNVEKGVLAPPIDQQLPLDADHALLLGWSSWGGGMEDIQALLVSKTKTRVFLKDMMIITTSRSAAGVVVLPDAKRRGYRIGLAKPAEVVHAAEDWKVVVAGKTMGIARIRSLKFEPIGQLPGQVLRYYPPFAAVSEPSSDAKVPLKYTWFRVDPTGFHTEAEAR